MIFKIVSFLIRISLIPEIIRIFFQRSNVTILLYHEICSEVFEKHVNFLDKKYNIISFPDYIDYIRGDKKLPKYSLIITFDDGHRSNYKLLSILIKYQTCITIFLISSLIDTKRHFWFRESKEVEYLKTLNDNERLKVINEKYNFQDNTEYPNRTTLNLFEINEMKDFVDFQSHTQTHPILPNCSREKSKKEIFDSKIELENKLNLSINGFAYPNGDYTEREIKYVIESGYSYAVTADPGFNNCRRNLFKLKRFSCPGNADINVLFLKTTGVWHFLKRLI